MPVPEAAPPGLPALLAGRRRILVTGGAGYGLRPTGVNIGGAVVRRLLAESDALVFNLDKCGYASDLTSIEALPEAAERHTLLQVDLTNSEATAEAVHQADPDLVLHLAAESHVDRSIEGPGAYGSTSSPDCVTITSNVNDTFHLLQAVRAHWQQHPPPNSQLITTTAAFICGDSPTHPSRWSRLADRRAHTRCGARPSPPVGDPAGTSPGAAASLQLPAPATPARTAPRRTGQKGTGTGQ